MRFKNILTLLAVVSFIGACNSADIPDKQKALPEDIVSQNTVTEKNNDSEIPGTSRWTESHMEIHSLIVAGQIESAQRILEEKIFGPRSLEKVFYISPEYAGYLDLYSELVESESLSLDQFERHFIQPCLDPEQNICELISSALQMSSRTANLMVLLAERKKESVEKLKILGLAYDKKSRRGSTKLDSMYLLLVIEVLDKIESGHISLDETWVEQHRLNAQTVIVKMQWGEPTPEKMTLFEKIRPWEVGVGLNTGSALDSLREKLVSFLPIYAERSNDVIESLQRVVDNKIKEIKKDNKNLKDYPAFADINIEELLEKDTLVSYLSLGVFYRSIGVNEANDFILKLSDPGYFAEQAFLALKLLVRYDVAQLSVYSTEQLQSKFSEQETKTNSFIQETFQWAKSLTPVWNEFHAGRGFAAKSFIQSSSRYTTQFDEQDVQTFFNAINRNIVRTTVFPNMMAFSYYMAKTDWKASFKIWFYIIEVDTNDLMDQLMTGQFENPWFNFTNLAQTSGRGLSDKTSLFRSELYDALYYFFTTRTNQVYGIKADDFLSQIGETVFRTRRSLFEATMTTQRDIYMSSATPSGYVLNWCEKLNTEKPESESIPFYELYQYITPNNILTEHSDYTGKRPYYFSDTYTQVPGFERLHSTNDRYRMELEPIIHTLNRYKSLTDRVAAAFPKLDMGVLEKTNKNLAEYELLRMNYLGVQKAIGRKMGRCLHKAEAEAKRRVKQVAFGHYDYFQKIVHPLMEQVKNGELSVQEANNVLQRAHGNKPGITDRIEASAGLQPIFVVSRLNYMLRTREMLISGFDFTSAYTKPVSVKPIVGKHLKIAIPSNFLSDTKNNNYLHWNASFRDYFKINFDEDSEVFADAASRQTTDESRATIAARRFTSWDRTDLGIYLDEDRYQLEYEITMLQISDHKYMDVMKPGCWTTKVENINPDCIISEEPDLKDVTDLMIRILKAYRITDEDRHYFEIISRASWADQDALHSILEFDPTTPYDWSTNSVPYQRLAGVLDMPHRMLDANYLGIGFQTEFDVELSKGEDKGPGISCEVQRDGCFWANERQHALEFFYARSENPKMLFRYDLQIVKEDFEYTRDRAMAKYQRLIDLEKQSDEILRQVVNQGNFSGNIEINRYKKPQPLRALSPSFRNNHVELNKFFKEETESYFLKNHDWQDYRIQ